MKPFIVTSGEPAGIGPDICLALAACRHPVVIAGDIQVLQQRCHQLSLNVTLQNYELGQPIISRHDGLYVWHHPCGAPVTPGKLDVKNAQYVLDMIGRAVQQCQKGVFSGLVTAPIHKGNINEAGIPFTGHTEWLAMICDSSEPVMMLACEGMKVALATTHLPLKSVSSAVTEMRLIHIIMQLYQALQQDFSIANPHILVAGLNPHAGEGGHLGGEEIDIIKPAIMSCQARGVSVAGPMSADTMFMQKADCFLAMYHDQGLPVLKYAGFGTAVNITLGLPVIRTSVDHGTALPLAASGQADASSLLKAVDVAASMAHARMSLYENY